MTRGKESRSRMSSKPENRNDNFPARFITGLVFVLSGVVHFVQPEFYMKIMPEYVPWPRQMVLISGIFEVLGGVALWLPKLKRGAAWSLVALLVAVFPANVYHAQKRKDFSGVGGSPVYHAIRLPSQGAMIWWVLRLAKPEK